LSQKACRKSGVHVSWPPVGTESFRVRKEDVRAGVSNRRLDEQARGVEKADVGLRNPAESRASKRAIFRTSTRRGIRKELAKLSGVENGLGREDENEVV